MTEESVFLRNPSYTEAIIGCTTDGAVVYSYTKMVECLMKEDDMTWDDAVDFLEYNTLRAIPYMESAGVPPVVVYEKIFDFELQDEIDRIRKEDGCE